MEPDEITEDEELETQDPEEADDSITPEEEPEQEAPAQKLTYEEKLANAKDDAERFAIANAEAAKQRRLRAKERKGVQPPADAPPADHTQPSAVDVDERILLANGMAPKLLAELKVIAQLREVSLIDAQKDDLFVAVKEKFDKEQKRREAGSGPGRGSGRPVVQKTTATPGLSRDEHRKAAGYAR